MNQYIVNLNCRVDARTAEEAKEKALTEIRIKEALPLVSQPQHVYERLRNFKGKKKEYFIALYLDTQNQVIKQETVSIGTLNTSLIHPREVFRPAILANCAAVIVCHNHPSGSLEPSSEDLQVTKRLQQAGRLIGIEIIDHIILTTAGFCSFRERNLL